ncbi:NADH-quinone oxidoreductase subunit C [Candidatus Poribacteria bacterium]|nr:NADH-quinone oxidoreductase subunit C [Candidatus Poribacteria bacterium]MYB63778.1 NADH-quinone oxidoreductase subunit C [Candidatus Poribacteria bacterium]MYF57061.1 NADH-quinone oxidoreductase subunit C [Candidatus Poribacteria bacterium]MYI92830.1 NADH-quinone oxidoreductase subunit C [Candidatus Poribacteria bacterium]
MSEEEKKITEETIPRVLEQLKEKFGDALLEDAESENGVVVVVNKEKSYPLLEYLKTELAYSFLVDVTAVDNSNLESELMKFDYARFMVVYHLYTYQGETPRLRVKVPVNEKDLKIQSVTDLWKGANWLERETYDMFGIDFEGHPDLRRILMPDDFEGHPLQKDYPLRGRGERESFNFEKQNV